MRSYLLPCNIYSFFGHSYFFTVGFFFHTETYAIHVCFPAFFYIQMASFKLLIFEVLRMYATNIHFNIITIE
jgi:hypothetical protein